MKKNLLQLFMAIVLPLVIVFTGCDDDDPKSTLASLTELSFMANDAIPGLENIEFGIDATTNIVTNEEELPYKSDVSALVIQFVADEKTLVTVNGEEIVSGTTTLDCSSPVTLIVTAEDGVTTEQYTINVKVSTVNPEGFAWTKGSNEITSFDYQTSQCVFFNGKYRALFGKAGNNANECKYYTSEDGNKWEEVVIEGTFPHGSYQNMMVANDKLYLCGFVTKSEAFGGVQTSILNHIYQSEDGLSFKKVKQYMTFHKHPFKGAGPAMFNLNETFYGVTGTSTGMGSLNGQIGKDSNLAGPGNLIKTCCSSTDLLTWTLTGQLPDGDDALPNGQMEGAARRYSANVVHNGKMFMIGGQVIGGYLSNLIWTSTDGSSWTKVTPSGLTPRMKAAAVSYEGKLYLIGGQTGLGTCTSEILVSEDDGQTWAEGSDDIKLPSDFKARAGHNAFVANDKIWIIGGHKPTKKTTDDGEEEGDPEMYSDVWSGIMNKNN